MSLMSFVQHKRNQRNQRQQRRGHVLVKLRSPLILSKEVRLTSLLCVQVSGHFSVISVEPRLRKRATCSATSSCTRGRNPLNVPSAATPVEEGTRSLATFALTQVEQIKA